MAARNNLSKLTLPMGAKGCDQIPSVGFGCWKVPRDVCASVVFNVIKVGYRALDCAADYGNEKEVRVDGHQSYSRASELHTHTHTVHRWAKASVRRSRPE